MHLKKFFLHATSLQIYKLPGLTNVSTVQVIRQTNDKSKSLLCKTLFDKCDYVCKIEYLFRNLRITYHQKNWCFECSSTCKKICLKPYISLTKICTQLVKNRFQTRLLQANKKLSALKNNNKTFKSTRKFGFYTQLRYKNMIRLDEII